MGRQQTLEFKSWGGARKGAGRPTQRRRASEHHKTRPELRPESILLVTLRSVPAVGNLRRPEVYHAIRHALYTVIEREHFRICQVSIQSNHIHLIVEADSKDALSRGLQAFEISAAKRVNATIKPDGRRRRRGAVFEDRYHERLLSSPRQIRNALGYVLNNWRRHAEDRSLATRDRKVDPYSSGVTFDGWRELQDLSCLPAMFMNAAPARYIPLSVSFARSWLLRVGWRRHGPISVHYVPGPAQKRELFGR